MATYVLSITVQISSEAEKSKKISKICTEGTTINKGKYFNKQSYKPNISPHPLHPHLLSVDEKTNTWVQQKLYLELNGYNTNNNNKLLTLILLLLFYICTHLNVRPIISISIGLNK